MKNFSLGQAWVSRVTRAEFQEVSVIGADVSAMPDAAEFQAVLRELSLTETAREMVRRKWIQPKTLKDKVAERGEAIFDFLFAHAAYRPAVAMFKGRRINRQRDLIEEIATLAWIAHVLDSAREQESRAK